MDGIAKTEALALLPEPAARVVEKHVQDVLNHHGSAKKSILAMGKSLHAIHEVYANHGNGSFGRLVEERFTFSRKHALDLINVFRVFGEDCNPRVTNLDDSSLRLLSAPSVPQKARDEALKIAATQPVTKKVAQQIVEKHKPAKPRKDKATSEPARKVEAELIDPQRSERTVERAKTIVASTVTILDVLNSINSTAEVIDAYASSDQGREVDAAKSANLLGQLKKAVAGGSRSHVVASDVSMPPPLNTASCVEALDRWLLFKRKSGGAYKDVHQVELQVKRWVEAGPTAFVSAIEYSIAQNYQGIHAEKANGTKATGQRSAPGSEYRPGDEDRGI